MLLSEMLGVKRDVDFEVIGYIGRFVLREQSDGTERLLWRLKDTNVYVNADLDVLYNIILKAPANIIHLPPPLTNEQKEQLKAIWTLGGRYLAKDKNNKMLAYDVPPVMSDSGYWWNCSYIFGVPSHLAVCGLVSSDSTIPYDIGKALGVTK